MVWLLLLVSIWSDGSVTAYAIDTHAEQAVCMETAGRVNAMPDAPAVKWSNTGCIQVPNPARFTEPPQPHKPSERQGAT